MIGAVAYSQRKLSYRLRFSSRKTMAISVDPGGAIEIVAPKGTSQEDVEARLRKRARWVLAQLAYFEQFRPRSPRRRYVGGETHLYLGRQYRLKISKGETDEVKLKGPCVCVVSRRGRDPVHVKRLLAGWYRRKAAARFNERVAAICARFQHLTPLPLEPVLRAMPRRWGSFNASEGLVLNPDLIRAPMPCIDYVITHELIHLAHPNHGRAFYELLDAMMPDWQNRKARLEKALA